MKVETKFNVNENVFVLKQDKIQECRIELICIYLEREGNNEHKERMSYKIYSKQGVVFDYVKESEMFKTKEELIKSLY